MARDSRDSRDSRSSSSGSSRNVSKDNNLEIEVIYGSSKPFKVKQLTFNPELDIILRGLHLEPLPAGNHVFCPRSLEGEQPEVSAVPLLTLAPPQKLPPLSRPVNYLRAEDTGEDGNHYPYVQTMTKLNRPYNIVKFDLPPPLIRTPWVPVQRFPLSRPARMAPLRDVNYLRCGRPVVSENLEDYNNNMFGYRRGIFTGMAPQRFVSNLLPTGDVACPRYSLPQLYAIQDLTIPSIVSFS